MEKFLNKAEKKYGKYAISNLTFYIISLYIIGYILIELASIFSNSFIGSLISYLTLDTYQIAKGQVWRLVSWVLIPPSTSNPLWFAIALFCIYSFGKSLENSWGAFRYNFFILTGLVLTVIGTAIAGLLISVIYPVNFEFSSLLMASYTTTHYVMMSVFIMVSLIYPDMYVLLFFVIPLKSKYVAIFFIALDSYDIISTALSSEIPLLVFIVSGTAFIMSLVNVLIYFLGARSRVHISRADKIRMEEFRRAVNSGRGTTGNGQGTYSGRFSRTGAGSGANSSSGSQNAAGVSKHKCAICGRTELDDPDLEFRFCSKCNGNYEYCNEHLFTHTHK